MSFNISEFRDAALPNGGFRPSLFEVTVGSLPGGLTGIGDNFRYLCQATQVPAMTVGVIEVPYFGRKVKIAGDRTYPEWTTTVMIEEEFGIRDVLEGWNSLINSPSGNLRSPIFETPESYTIDLNVTMFGKTGDPVRTYTLAKCWPSEIGAVELDWNTTDTIGTFTVTWQFDYMLSTGSAIGALATGVF